MADVGDPIAWGDWRWFVWVEALVLEGVEGQVKKRGDDDDMSGQDEGCYRCGGR